MNKQQEAGIALGLCLLIAFLLVAAAILFQAVIK
jgi:hypothetical protein